MTRFSPHSHSSCWHPRNRSPRTRRKSRTERSRKQSMRNSLVVTLLTGLLLPGCSDDRKTVSGISDAMDQVAADYPLVMMASPEITNYAPPVNRWPLKPGDRLTRYDLMKLWSASMDKWHRTALVWVVSNSGPAGAIPFGAWFTSEDGLLPHRDPETDRAHYHYLYRGHFPVKAYRPRARTFEKDIKLMEEALPPSLRGYVDPLDHLFTVEYIRMKRTWGSTEKFLESERAKYYGERGSW